MNKNILIWMLISLLLLTSFISYKFIFKDKLIEWDIIHNIKNNSSENSIPFEWYSESMNEHCDALNNIYDALEPSGIFVFDYLNSKSIDCGYSMSKEVVFDDVKFETTKSIIGKHIVKTIKVVDGMNETKFQEKVMAFSPSELISMLEEIGFTIISKYGNYQFDGFYSNQPRLIIIAQ